MHFQTGFARTPDHSAGDTMEVMLKCVKEASMANKVKLSIEVEPELRRRVKLAATSRDETVREWIVAAIRRELEAEADNDIIMPASGARPEGSKNPPRPRSGRLVSDAVIEDRRSGW